MTAQIIDGRKIAAALEEEVADDIRLLPGSRMHGTLVTVAVGYDFAAAAYQRRIERVATRLAVPYRHQQLPSDAAEHRLLTLLGRLGADPDVVGVLLLRPLPRPLREEAAFAALDPAKDIESVHPENAGLLALGTPRYHPSTPAAAFHVLDTWLDQQGEDRATFYENARIVVVGRSSNVGKPAVSMAYERRAAVTSIDEWSARGSRLGFHTRRADVLIVAAGVPGLIRAEHVKPGAIVLDIGINGMAESGTGAPHIVGDVAFAEVAARARAITPVPGGIGPVTDVWLLRTAVQAEQARHHRVAS